MTIKRRLMLHALVPLLLAGSATLLAAQQPDASAPSISPQDLARMAATTQGGSTSYEPVAREVDLDALPTATAAELAHVTTLRPRDGRTDAQYAAMKRQAALLGGNRAPLSPGPAPSKSSTYLTVSNVFRGQGENCCTPSDMALAVSPSWVVQFVNTSIAVYAKNGVLQAGYPKSATAFFGLPTGTYTTDPRGFFDWTNNRFVFVMLTESSFSSNNVGRLMVAVSKTSNPTGGWNIFMFQVGATGAWPAYPTLGHDSNNWGKNATRGAIYIGINQFANNCNGGFIQNYMFVIPKDAVYNGTGMYRMWFFNFNVGGTLVDPIQASKPAQPGDRPSASYWTNTFNILWNCGAGCANMVIWSVNNVAAFTTGGALPTVAAVIVPTTHTYFYPPSANQPGAPNSIETIDVRITGSMWYNAGRLFGSFETGVPNVPGAHPIWFEYHPILDGNSNITGASKELQEDCFFCGGQGTNGSAYFATLQPDPENNVIMTYNYSDDNIYSEFAVNGCRVSLGDSVMNGPGFAFGIAGGLYNQFRWGDYSATAPDLTFPSAPRMWASGMTDNAGAWGTIISAQGYPKPPDQ